MARFTPEERLVTEAALDPALSRVSALEVAVSTRELGTEHLDTVTTPGTYTQSANLEATLETGYPMTRGGVLQVERSVSKTMVWQTYTTYATSATTPPQTWQRGSYNGVWSAWARVDGSGMPDGGKPGQVLTTGQDGKAQWGAVSQTLNWSKDAQAKADGHVLHVGGDAPPSPTYTTADGVTVPVFWVKGSTTLQDIPQLPFKPYFDNQAKTVTVPEMVGVDYVFEGEVITGTYAFPADTAVARVEARAKAGYVLPAPFVWAWEFYDDAAATLLFSDGPTSANGGSSGIGPLSGRQTDKFAGAGTINEWPVSANTNVQYDAANRKFFMPAEISATGASQQDSYTFDIGGNDWRITWEHLEDNGLYGYQFRLPGVSIAQRADNGWLQVVNTGNSGGTTWVSVSDLNGRRGVWTVSKVGAMVMVDRPTADGPVRSIYGIDDTTAPKSGDGITPTYRTLTNLTVSNQFAFNSKTLKMASIRDLRVYRMGR